MKTFLLIHGKSPELSKMELRSVFKEEIVFQSEWVTEIKTDRVIDQKVMDILGGCIKICEIFETDPVQLLIDEAKTEKIVFGLSQYGGHDRISDLLLDFKKSIKEQGRNARFMNKDFKNISSGQLNKSKLIEKGVDLVRSFHDGREIWAKTIVFQDIDNYSKRDYEKPKRDMKVGMMPPKLCQMMINFSESEKSVAIYDPFCGLGSVLMEAMLMDHDVIGSDIKGRMIHSTEINLKWLRENFERTPEVSYDYFQHDATQAFPKGRFPENFSIVTEGFLGPVLSGFPDETQRNKIFKMLDNLNSLFYTHISQFIKKGNRLVMTFPFFRTGQKAVHYPEDLIRKYEANGFQIQHELRSLIYERKTQVVGREVIIFEKI
jgi:tRNA G10  N-methylase Trm11